MKSNPSEIRALKKINLSKNSLLLIVSFSALLLLTIFSVTFISLQIESTQANVNKFVSENNKKASLLIIMQRAARDRSLSLYKMINTKDQTEYNATYKNFKNYASIFNDSRKDFISMNLSEEELKLIKEQQKLSRKALPLQNMIIKFIDKRRFKDAINILIKKAIPSQNIVLAQLSTLIDIQSTNSKKMFHQLQLKLNKNIKLILTISTIIFIVSIFICAYVVVKITNTENQLFFEKELAQTTLLSIGDGVITVDKNYIIQTINPVAELLADVTKNEVTGKNILTIYEDESAKQRHQINKNLSNTEIKRSLFDFTLTKKDGSKFEVEHTIAPIIDKNKSILGAVIILRDVTDVRTMEKRLSFQASHDALTGLINRREFEVQLEKALKNSQNNDTTHSLCFLDLDKFKIINDTSGHAAGDEFLKQISKTIKSLLRQTDVLARLGGDEFAIILDNCSIKQSKTISNEIIKKIKATRFSWGKNAFEAGASMGIVPITKLSASSTELMSSVDAACYEAKDKGRNRIQVFQPDDAEFVKHKTETSWIQKIKDAINNDSFELYFQEIKKISPQQPSPKTIEVLIRLNNGDEVVCPDSFIPTAERYNLMPRIDEWVITHTFDFLNKYKEKHNDDIRVAINLSGQSLSDDTVLNTIINKLRRNKNIKKEHICFEITETAAIANMSKAIEFIAYVKQMGCSFSLDDFGSGLSSFSYLKNMPVDNLKIDGVFIREIHTDPVNKIFVQSIHNISKVMGIKTTAEYVESEEILDCIKEIGIDYAQGYHIAKPKPLKTLI